MLLKILSKNKPDFNKVTAVLKELRLPFEIFSPIPVDDSKIISKRSKSISFWMLTGALFGGMLALLFQYWSSGVDYKINLGGKEFFSLVYSVPIIFEIAVLFSAIFGFTAFLINSGLPRWYLDNPVIEDNIDGILNDTILIYMDITDDNAINNIKYNLKDNENIELILVNN